jgi:hypothetical protein
MLKQEEKRVIEFERPLCYGWTTVVFPQVHDENTVLEIWIADAFAWIDEHKINKLFWTFAHGKKKDGERISPMFFYKDRMDAIHMKWRFNGELVE